MNLYVKFCWGWVFLRMFNHHHIETEMIPLIPYRCQWHRKPNDRQRFQWFCSIHGRHLRDRLGLRERRRFFPRCSSCPKARFVCRRCQFWQLRCHQRWHFQDLQRVWLRVLVLRGSFRMDWSEVRPTCSRWCCLRIHAHGNRGGRQSIQLLRRWLKPDPIPTENKLNSSIMQVISQVAKIIESIIIDRKKETKPKVKTVTSQFYLPPARKRLFPWHLQQEHKQLSAFWLV